MIQTSVRAEFKNNLLKILSLKFVMFYANPQSSRMFLQETLQDGPQWKINLWHMAMIFDPGFLSVAIRF